AHQCYQYQIGMTWGCKKLFVVWFIACHGCCECPRKKHHIQKLAIDGSLLLPVLCFIMHV
ncbi:MAG: hypothetical protein LBJ38_02390, partial [Oscillospiraceae bacterium]|nr:hypothetical protein [Oscillospiraceae bacterium]